MPALEHDHEPTGVGRSLPDVLVLRRLAESVPSPSDQAPGRFPTTHRYLEACWLPVIGPSASWCLRRLCTELESHPKGVSIECEDLARDLGLSTSLSSDAPISRTLRRLCDFGLARITDDFALEVRTELPPLSLDKVARLSDAAQNLHHELVAEAANPMLSAALSYARRGWPVLPLKAGEKVPDGRLVPHGLLDATANEAQLRAWWAASPEANVGIRTGEGIDVVDLDGDAARQTLLALAPERLSEAVVVRTARGWHLWFATCGLATRAGVLDDVDVRGRGGYVVAPPSVHPEGWRYQFLDPRSHELSTRLPGTPLRPVPQWLRERLEPPARPERLESEPIRLTSSHYARVALDSECAAVGATLAGRRNDRLNAAAFSIGTLVGAEVIDAGEAHDRLLAAAISAGLQEREARRTIASGMQAGERQPRQLVKEEQKGAPGTRRSGPPDPSARPDERASAAVLARAQHRVPLTSPSPAALAPHRIIER